MVNQVVKLADAGVMTLTANVDRFEDKTGMSVLSTVAQAALPSAVALSALANQIEQKSADLASKIAGKKPTAKRVRSTVARKARPVAKAVVKSVKKMPAKVVKAVDAVAA